MTADENAMLASPRDCLVRSAMLEQQREQVCALWAEVLPRNRFFARKFAACGITPRDIDSLADLARLPFTTKAELLEDQQANPPFGTVLTYPLDQYCRMCQTSGTSDQPLRWLDTAASWTRMLHRSEERRV